MVVKVCGIKTEENIQLISTLNVEMIGLNFYPASSRYVGNVSPTQFDILPDSMARVGVFVNEEIAKVQARAKKYKLDYIQLHGDEDISYCRELSSEYKLIKVFRVKDELLLDQLILFDFVDFFLFDTASKQYGGSGKKFSWDILKSYEGSVPFLLSGGIGPEDTQSILYIHNKKFAGIDINSKFESSPAVKSSELLIPFLNTIRK